MKPPAAYALVFLVFGLIGFGAAHHWLPEQITELRSRYRETPDNVTAAEILRREAYSPEEREALAKDRERNRVSAEEAVFEIMGRFDYSENGKAVELGKALARLAIYDPERAVRLVPNQLAAGYLFGPWSKRDPREALGYIHLLPENIHDYAADAIYREWSRNEPKRAFDFYKRNTVGHVGLAGMIEGLAEADPIGGAEFALSLKGDLRKRAVRAFSTGIRLGDSTVGEYFARTVVAEDGLTKDVGGALIAWSRADALSVLDFLLKQPACRARQDFIISALEKVQDRAAALEIAERMGTMPGSVIYQMTVDACKKDPDKMLPIFLARPAGGYRESGIRVCAEQMAEKNLNEAWRVADRIMDFDAQDFFLTGIINTIYRKDPVRAMDALGQLSSPELGVRKARSLAERWVQFAPENAIKWAMEQPEGPFRAVVFNEVVNRRLNTDALSASEFIESLPAGESRDTTITTFADRVVRYEPLGAMQFALSMKDADRRMQVIERTWASWKSKDAAEAVNWLGTAAISSELRRRLEDSK